MYNGSNGQELTKLVFFRCPPPYLSFAAAMSQDSGEHLLQPSPYESPSLFKCIMFKWGLTFLFSINTAFTKERTCHS